MNSDNFHPVLNEPPNAHALHKWDELNRTLTYEYNGTDIIRLTVPTCGKLGFRHGSDGSLQSMQYVQQIYVTNDEPVEAQLRFLLTSSVINMRPCRAGANQAVLGQIGKPLIQGINGLYDVNWDLLIDWHGAPWFWGQTEIKHDAEGMGIITINLTLCEKPFFINIRPQYYRKHLGYAHHKPWDAKPNPKPVSGWCSWEAYRREIDIDKVKKIAEFIGQHLLPYGMEYIQIDDGYQKMPLPFNPSGTMAEGWLTCEETRFPDGHGSIIQAIKDKGLRPGVWTNSNITHEDFPKHHADNVIWHDDKALKGEWIDFIYNCTPETLEKHVVPLFQSLAALGYEYVKIDAIRHLLFDGLHECVRLGMMTNDDAENRFRAYMAATRKGLGNGVYYLASWGEMGEVIGLVDACRIATDANPTWPGVRMQLLESARWFFTQRILFLNDPDHVCARTKPEWAKSVLSLVSLSGQLYMLSDAPEDYTAEKLDIIRKTLPPLTTYAAETGVLNIDYPAFAWTKQHGFAFGALITKEADDVSPKEAWDIAGEIPTLHDAHPFASLWSFHFRVNQRAWAIAARFALLPLEESEIPLENLGLDGNKRYVAFDFWAEEGLGVIEKNLKVKALPLGHCQIISLYEYNNTPMIVASTRHVSMDAVSIESHAYIDNALCVALNGVPSTKERYFVYVPPEMSIKGVIGNDCGATIANIGSITTLEVCFTVEKCSITVLFN